MKQIDLSFERFAPYSVFISNASKNIFAKVLPYFLSLMSYCNQPMQEALIHYIWRNSLFDKNEFIADTGEKISIVETGMHNSDGGPDFTNARIRINDTLWAGNVEIHKKTSDWNHHKHHTDAAYDNVVLHVSIENNNACINSQGRRIPSIQISFDPEIEERYKHLIADDSFIPCHKSLSTLNTSLIYFWLSALTIERLSEKTASIQELLKSTKNNWEEAYYINLARSFGLKINALPFELLTKATPLKITTKHRHSLFELEALFFGQAGFLQKPLLDDYHESLYKEYQYLKQKYALKEIEVHLWKYLRLRPSNFPTIRIAQFCSLIYKTHRLFSNTMESQTSEELLETYSCSVSNYWKNHYKFGKEAEFKNKPIGLSTRMSLIINTIIPFMFTYGNHKNREQLKEKAIHLLEMIPAEKNKIIDKWSEYQVKCRHAGDSQALLQLTNRYCSHKQCLDCQIGNLVLRNS